MQYQFSIRQGAKDDLRNCREADSYAAAQIAALLRELAVDDSWCGCLVDPHYIDDDIESVAAVARAQELGLNCYRLKLVAVAAWRLVLAANHPTKQVCLMAVGHRDVVYQDDNLWERIGQEYDELGFTRLGR